MTENPVWIGVTSLFAVMLSVILCRFAGSIGGALGLVDHPTAIKLHRRPTPLIGGLALILVLVPSTPIFMVLFDPEGVGNRALTTIVAATVMMATLGACDDRKALPAVLRFALSLAIFTIAMLVEPRLIIDRLLITGMGSSVTLPWGVAMVLSAFIYVGFVNSVNMTDGKNGLVISLCIIWMLALLAVGPKGLIIVLLPLLQMLGVLLIYNLQGRLFLGDGGTYGLSAFLALVSVYVYRTSEVALRADQLAVMYLVPGLDMLRLFFTRVARGSSPFAGDRDHLHHLFEARFGWKVGLVFYLVLVIAPIAFAITVPDMALVVFFAGCAVYAAIVIMLSRGRRLRASADKNGELISETNLS